MQIWITLIAKIFKQTRSTGWTIQCGCGCGTCCWCTWCGRYCHWYCSRNLWEQRIRWTEYCVCRWQTNWSQLINITIFCLGAWCTIWYQSTQAWKWTITKLSKLIISSWSSIKLNMKFTGRWGCTRCQWANWCHCIIIVNWPFATWSSISIGRSGSSYRWWTKIKRWTECRCVSIKWITTCCQRWCIQCQSYLYFNFSVWKETEKTNHH